MENKQEIGLMIEAGRTSLGIELGSTRIKAVLIGENGASLASATHEWENRLQDGIWTYPMSAVWTGLQDVYQKLTANIKQAYSVCFVKTGAIGVSAMMHGYLPFDANGNQLAPFRTWRNTITEEAAARLTEAFGFHIPQRWSIAHLYRAMLENESHVQKIGFLTTLAGYVHYKLTGERVLGVCDASGMFPIDTATGSYNREMLSRFNNIAKDFGVAWQLEDILPAVRQAGEPAGRLSEEGALLLDPSGRLEAGIPFCPPEGDAGTGMVATNAVAPRMGNVSAGTSVFAMIVLEKPLLNVHAEIDLVTTPTGKPVAMVHCNNCTTDFDAWVKLFGQVLSTMGVSYKKSALYDAIYAKALQGDPDCGGLVSYNYDAGEHITGFEEGRPLFLRLPNSAFNLQNFARTLLFSAMATLRIGMDILTGREAVRVDVLRGHGGLFKTPKAGQTLLAEALGMPVSVREEADEGGAWGIALLADYMRRGKTDETLEEYLNTHVFFGAADETVVLEEANMAGFFNYLARYKACLVVERAAVEHLR
ncbi:hypothetical protein LJC07_02145 [Christensenellaceae bacterium OttesenSCG-928-L17]|nr:hypothetical protein [Christensenellaceae bacterium OttesenSCG-928-L17]